MEAQYSQEGMPKFCDGLARPRERTPAKDIFKGKNSNTKKGDRSLPEIN